VFILKCSAFGPGIEQETDLFLFLHSVSHQMLRGTFSQPALLVLIIIKCLKRILYKNDIILIAKSLLSTQIYMSYNLNFIFYNIDFYHNLL